MKIAIKFQPRDIWVGVHWDFSTMPPGFYDGAYWRLYVYICILPMFPICMEFNVKY